MRSNWSYCKSVHKTDESEVLSPVMRQEIIKPLFRPLAWDSVISPLLHPAEGTAEITVSPKEKVSKAEGRLLALRERGDAPTLFQGPPASKAMTISLDTFVPDDVLRVQLSLLTLLLQQST